MATSKPSAHSSRLQGLAGVGALVAGLVGATLMASPSVAAPGGGRASAVETIPTSAVRPGMRGHAVTVFEGEQTDKFEIEIVDVIHHYLPKQDAVLFKSNDPRLTHSGIVGGMSGSPIFVEGKLLGALAYGWRFNKDPLGGLTPISNMQAVGALPYRPDVLPHPGRVRGREGAAGWADAMLGLETSPLPARRTPESIDPTAGMTALSVPMTIGGLGPSATHMLSEAFGLTPVRGGSGGGSAPAGKTNAKRWGFGDSVSVVLVRGDSSVAGNGTVTWVSPKGDRLLAFGHSMFEDGPTNVPMASARVHTIINSVERSVKLSSPLEIQGLMYQDRQAAIALRTDLRAPMIPVVTTMAGPDPDLEPRTYRNEVAVGLELTPNLTAVILAEAVDEAGRDAVEVVLEVQHEIDIETSAGARTVKMEEEVFFPSGLVGRVMGRSRGVVALAAMLDNEFEVARIRGIRHAIKMKYAAPVDQIQSLRLHEDEVHAGQIVRLEVVLRSYKGDERVEVLPLRVPADAGGEEVQIQIAGADFVRPYRPIPGSLDDLITTLEQSYPSRALVASIYRQGEGLSTKNGLLLELPDSVLETLSSRGTTKNSIRFKQLARRVIPTKSIIEGEHSIKVDVLPAKTF